MSEEKIKDRSTLGKEEFMEKYAIGAILSMSCYRVFLFRPMGIFSAMESKVVLWAFVIVCAFAARYLFFEYRRTEETVADSLMLAYGLYTMWAYSAFIHTVLRLIGCLCVVETIFIFEHYIKLEKKSPRKKRGSMTRFYMLYTDMLEMAALAMIMLMIAVLVMKNWQPGVSALRSLIQTRFAGEQQEQTIAGNIETLTRLQEEEWKILTDEEKMDVLQTVTNIEGRYLGIPNKLTVEAKEPLDTTLARYLDETHTLYINEDFLSGGPAKEVLTACCHEVYHAYQHRIVDAYHHADEREKDLQIYRKALLYSKEFENYTSGTENYFTYYTQQCEIDARSYAASAADDYMERIAEYLEE